MDENILSNTVARLVMPPKGILAVDESVNTCNKRFEKLGIPTTEEKRRDYRELLISAPDIENFISGYILFDETIRQKTLSGVDFIDVLKFKGIDIGIKVDQGLVDFPPIPGEKLTQGLEGLSDRLKEYRKMGATFAKWRAVYSISETTPSELCMKTNAEILVKYALACQNENIVPILEPEVLMDGEHDLQKCYEVTSRNLKILFTELADRKVFLPGIILKTSMILPGKDNKITVYPSEIAKMTIKCLKEKVSETIGGIVFLSGGQTDEEATARLDAMHELGALPWPLTFSYGRAIQNSALQSWARDPSDISLAQSLLLAAAKNNSLASVGQYK